MAPKHTLSRGRTAFYGGVVALLLVGCDGDSLIVVDSCFGVAVVFVAPQRGVVRVGDTVTLDANFAHPECVPAGITTEEWRWSSSDTRIARIDSLTGLAEGVAPGTAVIEVHHARHSEVMSSTGLTVVAN